MGREDIRLMMSAPADLDRASCSHEAAHWIRGYLSGHEPAPPLDPDGYEIAETGPTETNAAERESG